VRARVRVYTPLHMRVRARLREMYRVSKCVYMRVHMCERTQMCAS